MEIVNEAILGAVNGAFREGYDQGMQSAARRQADLLNQAQVATGFLELSERRCEKLAARVEELTSELEAARAGSADRDRDRLADIGRRVEVMKSYHILWTDKWGSWHYMPEGAGSGEAYPDAAQALTAGGVTLPEEPVAK